MRYYSNTAVETELATGINNLETTLIVGATTGWPGTFPYTIVIDEGESTEELCSVTAVSGTQITVTRGHDGTSAVAHAASATVKHCVSAQDFREAQEHFAATSAHGLSGDLVGDTDAQTLTNKDLSASTNSFPSTLVTTTGAQTLTGKTLTAPVLTGATGSLTDPEITRSSVTILAPVTISASWHKNGTLGSGTLYRTFINEELCVVTGLITCTSSDTGNFRGYFDGPSAPTTGTSTMVGTASHYVAATGGFHHLQVVYSGGLFFLVDDGGSVAVGYTLGVSSGDQLQIILTYRV